MPKQTLKRRADGRYQKRITLSNGKTRLVYGRTEAELKAAVRSVQAQDEAGLEVGDHTLVGEWAKIWLRSYKQGLRPATTKMYRDAYNLHIMQHIGCMELQEVRPVHIRAIMAEITEQSESLQHKVLITVRQIMQTAQANHLIRDDPTDGIRITTHARPKQKKYLTQDEAEELLSSIAEPRAKVFCALCYYCGLRKEEALGLQWRDIGPAALVVSRAVTFAGDNQPDPSMELKNAASHRLVPVPAKLRAILNATPRLGEHVVTKADGGVMTQSAYKKDVGLLCGGGVTAAGARPHAAPQLCHLPVPRRCGSAHRPAAAWSRQHRDDGPHLHPSGSRRRPESKWQTGRLFQLCPARRG